MSLQIRLRCHTVCDYVGLSMSILNFKGNITSILYKYPHKVVIPEKGPYQDLLRWCEDHYGEELGTWVMSINKSMLNFHFKSDSDATQFAITWS